LSAPVFQSGPDTQQKKPAARREATPLVLENHTDESYHRKGRFAYRLSVAKMSQQDKYFTFPISFLQLGKSLDDVTPSEAKKRTSQIMDWCIWEMNKHLAHKRYDDPSGDVILSEMAHRHPNAPDDFGNCSESDWLAAQQMLGLSHTVTWENGKKLAATLESLVSMDAGKKLARVRGDIMWNALDGKIAWRDFAVLVAIYAGCFSEKKNGAANLKFSQLRTMAIGYGSKKHCHDHNSDGLVLSEKAIGRTVAKLLDRGFFVKASPDNGRNTYYSNRMSEAQMIQYVTQIKASKIRKKRSRLTQREINQQVTERANAMAGLTQEQEQYLREVTARRRSSLK